MGTPLYMSPEQVEGKEVDPRSDLYSFGVTCYHMLAGSPPFLGDTALAVAMQHLNNEPNSLEKLRPDIAAECPELCPIVHKLLAKKPDARFATANDLVRRLRNLSVEGLEEAAARLGVEIETLPEITPAMTEATQQLQAVLKDRKAKAARDTWMLPAIAGLVCLLMLVCGAAYAWLNPPKPLLAIRPDDLPPTSKMDSAYTQYMTAMISPKNKEQNLKAVAEYFPPAENTLNMRYSLLAKVALANYYRQQNKAELAYTLYDELARLDEVTQAQFHAAGLAGKALVLQMQGKTDDVPEALSLAVAKLNQLGDDTLRADLEALARLHKVPIIPPPG
jgi:serine/threonine-protein kinase